MKQSYWIKKVANLFPVWKRLMCDRSHDRAYIFCIPTERSRRYGDTHVVHVWELSVIGHEAGAALVSVHACEVSRHSNAAASVCSDPERSPLTGHQRPLATGATATRVMRIVRIAKGRPWMRTISYIVFKVC